MTLTTALVAVLLIAAAAGFLAFRRARRLRGAGGRLNSLPSYHAFYAAMWSALPALLIVALYIPVESRLVDNAVLASAEGRALPAFEMQRVTILNEAREIAHGDRDVGFNPESTALAPRILEAEGRYGALGGGIAILAALAGAGLALRRVGLDFRARAGVER